MQRSKKKIKKYEKGKTSIDLVLLCLCQSYSYISVTVINFTHPLVLSTLLLILSASRFLILYSPGCFTIQ